MARAPTIILELVKGLAGVVSKFLLGLFLVRHGEQKQQLKGKTKEVKDAQKAGKRKSHIAALSDDALDSGLRK